MITRRRFLRLLGTGTAALLAMGGYAVGYEPNRTPIVRRYDLKLPRWPKDAKTLTVAVLADVHAVDPWMTAARIAAISDATNALGADLILLLGDYTAGTAMRFGIVRPPHWAAALGRLRAPLGVHAILGNHDWTAYGGPDRIRHTLETAGIPVLVNAARRVEGHGHRFWLTGTDSMLARGAAGPGAEDLAAALAGVTDDGPIIHIAHEPDLFPEIPDRVALTVSGHTHGGQVRLPIVGPLIRASRFGDRYVHGHVEENGRHLLISAGLGCTYLPVRFLVPPEIVHLTIGATA